MIFGIEWVIVYIIYTTQKQNNGHARNPTLQINSMLCFSPSEVV